MINAAARTGPACCLVHRALFRDKRGEFLHVWVANISWLFDVLWQCGRWPFPLLALLIICSLLQQHPSADGEGSSTGTVWEQLLQERAVLEGARLLPHWPLATGMPEQPQRALFCHLCLGQRDPQAWPGPSESSSLAAPQDTPCLMRGQGHAPLRLPFTKGAISTQMTAEHTLMLLSSFHRLSAKLSFLLSSPSPTSLRRAWPWASLNNSIYFPISHRQHHGA